MSPEIIKALAAYFTHAPRVVHHSIALEVGGKMGAEGLAFFEMRRALGLHGYVGENEAIVIMTEKMNEAV